MAQYLTFWVAMIKEAFTGDKRYFTWLGGLSVFILFGMVAYYFQFTQGLEVTNLSDQVSWGVYIANFTFLVGVAAAAVLLVVPAYVFKMKSVKKVVLLGELLAVSAIVMCMLFIMVDMGRPDRFWHVIPFIGRLNFPKSVLAWDVVVLNGYLLLNLHIPGYLLYQLYLGKKPHQSYYLPFVYTSIFWAVSIHTVTAFLYSGLGGRPYWNAAILAPRFLISAFAGGPPLLIIIFTVINHFYKDFDIEESVFDLLKKITAVTLPINMFLLGCELFKEFYTDSTHVASAKYLFFGLHGHHLLVPYIWAAIAFSSIGMVIFLMPKYRNQQRLVLGGSVLIIIGIWIEKGMGLIIPGFVPSPLGDIVEYTPSAHEFFISLGIWAAGAMIFTLMAKSALAISSGKLRKS